MPAASTISPTTGSFGYAQLVLEAEIFNRIILAPNSAKTRKLGVQAPPRRRWDAMHCCTKLHREDCRARALLGPCARYSGGRGGFQ